MQTEYKVHLELDYTFSVCFDENEPHSEEDAIQYILDNEMKNIREMLRNRAWAEEA